MVSQVLKSTDLSSQIDESKAEVFQLSAQTTKQYKNTEGSPKGQIEKFDKLPNIEGYFVLSTHGFEQPVQVVSESGIFLLKMFDGQRISELSKDQVLFGPIFDFSNPGMQKVLVNEHNESPVPTKSELNYQDEPTGISLSDYEKLELELNQALEALSVAETECIQLKKQNNTNSNSKKLLDLQNRIEKLSNDLSIANQRANVAEEESALATTEIECLSQENSVLRDKSEEKDDLLEKLSQKVQLLESQINTPSANHTLPSSFYDALAKLQTFLVPIRSMQKDSVTYKMLDEIIESLDID